MGDIALGDKKRAEPFLRIQSSYNHIGTQQDGTYLIGKQEAWATNITLGTRYVQEFSLGGSVNIPVGKDSAINAGATLRLYGGTTEVNANVGYSHKF